MLRTLPFVLSVATAFAAPQPIQIDVADVDLEHVASLLTAQTGTKIVADEASASTPVTFAAKNLSRSCTVRWLCRTCALVATSGDGGSIVLGAPDTDPSVAKSYTITSLIKNDEEGEALLEFVKAVHLVAFQKSAEDIRLEAKYGGGKLAVLAPKLVHREVLALLQAMARAKSSGDDEEATVKYAAYDLGLLRTSKGAPPLPLKGDISVPISNVTARRAAWLLTSNSDVSFYVDPWDSRLGEAKVSLPAGGTSLAAAAKALATAMNAEVVPYDGAWLFVRAARKPLFEGIDVRASRPDENVLDRIDVLAMARRLMGNRQAGLPFAVSRVGRRLLVSLPTEKTGDFSKLVEAIDENTEGDDWRRRVGPRRLPGAGRPVGGGRPAGGGGRRK